MRNKQYIVFCPYFGKLPDMFPLWLISCGYNSHMMFIVFTDDETEYALPENVKIYRLLFQEFRKIIQKKFEFKIALNQPYKLCDFKVTYGFVFEEHIKEYIYWGYCDLDLLFGDLCKYIPRSGYEKISHLGHLALYKNIHEINCCFMDSPKGLLNYRDILGSAMHFGFDEIGEYGVNSLFEKRGYKIYELEKHIADIYPYHKNLSIALLNHGKFFIDKKERIFTFDDGKIFAWSKLNGAVYKKEYAYIHMQKRNITCKISYGKHFLIQPHCITDCDSINAEMIEAAQEKGIYWFAILLKGKAIFHRIHRWTVIKGILKEK